MLERATVSLKAQFEKYILLFRSRNVLYVKRVFRFTVTRSAIQRTKDARHCVETNLFHLATLPFKDVALTVMV
jgi:hypothetical protein